MREHLIKYVELLFVGAENAADIREEILQNTLDRYDDLIAQGKSPEAAYQLAISGIGDVREILNARPELQPKPEEAVIVPVSAQDAVREVSRPEPPKKYDKPVWKRILQALGIGLYILSPLPLFLLQSELGLCGLLVICAVATVFMILGAGSSKQGPGGEKGGYRKVIDIVITILCLCIYLPLSFLTGAWTITWLLFPLSACVKGFIFAIIDLVRHSISRGKAIVRIIIFSILIPLLAGILSTSLGFYTYTFRIGSASRNQVAQGQTICLTANTVDRLSVEWVSGNVDIQTADTDQISFQESGALSDANKLVWKQVGSSLVISEKRLFWGSAVTGEKDLTVVVPSDWSCKDLEVNTVSGKVTLDGLTVLETEAESASASYTFRNCQISKLSLSTVSGDVRYENGAVTDFSFDTVSGDCHLDLTDTAADVEIDTVSGNAYLQVTADCGFTATLDSISGDFLTQLIISQEGDRYVYADGDCIVDVDTVSGNLSIHAKE